MEGRGNKNCNNTTNELQLVISWYISRIISCRTEMTNSMWESGNSLSWDRPTASLTAVSRRFPHPSRQILSNSSFINHPLIRSRTVYQATALMKSSQESARNLQQHTSQPISLSVAERKSVCNPHGYIPNTNTLFLLSRMRTPSKEAGNLESSYEHVIAYRRYRPNASSVSIVKVKLSL